MGEPGNCVLFANETLVRFDIVENAELGSKCGFYFNASRQCSIDRGLAGETRMTMRLTSILVGIGALLGLFVFMAQRNSYQDLAATGIQVPAVVTNLTSSHGWSNTTNSRQHWDPQVTYKFPVDGQEVYGQTSIDYSQYCDLMNGHPLTITYSRTNPDFSSPSPKTDEQKNLMFAIGSGFLFLVSIFVFWCSFSATEDSSQPTPSTLIPTPYMPDEDFLGGDRFMRHRFTWTLAALGLASVLMIIFAFLTGFTSFRLAHGGVTTDAMVVKKWSNQNGYNVVDYRYTVGEKQISGDAHISDTKYDSIDTGSPLKITYLPNEPEVASLAPSEDLHSSTGALLIGAGLGLICIFVAVVRSRFPIF